MSRRRQTQVILIYYVRGVADWQRHGRWFQRGRPPDDVVVVEGLNVLERSGSPVPQAVQPLQKRGRGLEEAMLIDDELINEETEVRVLDGGGQQLKDAAGGMSELPIPSFKDKLVGDKGCS
ncbi:hypothetical protein V6N13_121691 [Hibiscus sabdariffa]